MLLFWKLIFVDLKEIFPSTSTDRGKSLTRPKNNKEKHVFITHNLWVITWWTGLFYFYNVFSSWTRTSISTKLSPFRVFEDQYKKPISTIINFATPNLFHYPIIHILFNFLSNILSNTVSFFPFLILWLMKSDRGTPNFVMIFTILGWMLLI